MKKLTFLLFLISCNPFKISEKDITNIEVQTSLNDKYKIYNYTIGMGAMGDDFSVTKIFEKDEDFDLDEGFTIDGNIGEWISKDTLTINRFTPSQNNSKDTLTKISYEKYEDLVLKVKSHSTINSGKINEYIFKNLKINKNKITFYGIEKVLGSDIGTVKSFNLGNINFHKAKDSLASINIEIIYKTMNFTYYNNDGSIAEDQPEIGVKSLKFIPKRKILYSKLKNVKGVFHTLK